MKKFIVFLTAFMLTAVTVFADGAEEFSEVVLKSSMLRSAEINAEMSAELNEPLKFISSIPDIVGSENVDIDVQALIESLVDAKSNISCTYSASEDFKKINMGISVEYDAPVVFNDSFKLNAWTKIGMWIDYDVSDAENPVYKIIMKIPFLKKYTVMDMSENLKAEGSTDLDIDKITEINRKAVESLKDNAEITKSGSSFTVRMDDKSAKQYILEVFGIAGEIMPQYAVSDLENAVAGMKYLFENVQIFGSDGITIEFTVTPDGYIGTENAQIHICTNLYDILTALSKSTEGLAREDAVIDMTFSTNETLSKNNQAVVTDMPELTEENSEVIASGAAGLASYSRYANKNPLFKDNTIYYPLEDIILPYGFSVEDENGKINIKSPDSSCTVTFDTEKSELSVNGENAEIVKTALIYDGEKIYCSEDVFILLGVSVCVEPYDFERKAFSIGAWRTIREDTYENTEPDIGGYIPPTIEYNFPLNRIPYIENNKCYMPIYEFLTMISPGSFSYGESYLEYTADNQDNKAGLATFSARGGDSYVMLNGNQISIDGIVADCEGVMYIPVSFAENMGLSPYVYAYFIENNSWTDFYFSMPNPEYDEEQIYYEQNINMPFFDVYSDRLPYMDGEIVYMPAYDFFKVLFAGEFSFDGDLMTYTASGENNVFGIGSISVRPGDDFVTADGKQIKLEAAAVEIDGVIRIPVSFAEELGLNPTGITVYNWGRTSYNFYRYTDEYSYDKKHKNWLYDLFWGLN